ncbi:MAG: hypothetical protein ACJAZM_000558 [Cyclobacteriaceae bacterium]|jgi:hypothetical protein
MNLQSITMGLLALVYLSCSSEGEQAEQKSASPTPIPEVGDIVEFSKPLTFQITKVKSQTSGDDYSPPQSPDGAKFVILDEVDPTASAVLIHLGEVSISPSDCYTSLSAKWSWSPDSRYVALIGEDTYAGFGWSGLIIIDTESSRFTEIEPTYFAKGVNIGQREMQKVESLGWSDDNTVNIAISVDYLGGSGHPGIDDSRQATLGDKFGISDPLSIGHFEIKITEEPATAYVTTKIVGDSQIPIAIDPVNSANEGISRINAAIRSHFDLTEEYSFNPYMGWGQVTSSSEVTTNYISITYSGVYMSSYPTGYSDELLLFSLASGEEIVHQPIAFRDFFAPDSFRRFLDDYWYSEVFSKFEEATNCAGMEPNCKMDDIQSYILTNDGLEISLTRDCYPHAAESCIPTHSTVVKLEDVSEYLNAFGKKVILEDRYPAMSVLEKLQYEEGNTLLTIVASGQIWRTDDLIKVVGIYGFKKSVQLGEMVQVMPLRSELPAMIMEITQIRLRNDVDYIPAWYEIELEDIEDEIFRTIAAPSGMSDSYPSDLLVVYPPVKGCKRLFPGAYAPSELPNGMTDDQVKGVLDFDADSIPDVVVTQYCCKEEADGSCDYTCGETYIKSDGSWYQVNESRPL